jgi:hypothetical protein
MKKAQLIISLILLLIIITAIVVSIFWGGQIGTNIWLQVISIFVAIITTLMFILVNFYADIWNRPELIFNIGDARQVISKAEGITEKKMYKIIKKEPTLGIVYGARAPKNSTAVFYLPFFLYNESKRPIKNITVLIKYPSRHYLTNKEISYANKSFGNVEDTGYLENRKTQINGFFANIEINIPVLREKEKKHLREMIKFANFNYDNSIEVMFTNEPFFTGGKLVRRLLKIDKLNDFCFAEITVLSETSNPHSRKIKILWFDTETKEELHNNIEKSVEPVFWDGRFPKPGFYFHPWNFEYWDSRNTNLRVDNSKGNINYYIEYWNKPPFSAIHQLKVPPWNYYY